MSLPPPRIPTRSSTSRLTRMKLRRMSSLKCLACKDCCRSMHVNGALQKDTRRKKEAFIYMLSINNFQYCLGRLTYIAWDSIQHEPKHHASHRQHRSDDTSSKHHPSSGFTSQITSELSIGGQFLAPFLLDRCTRADS